MAILLTALELLSTLALVVLDRRFHASYQPVDRLAEKHQGILEQWIEDDPNSYLRHSATLGWTIRENTNTGLCQSNGGGFRASRDYATRAPYGVVRVAAFGDSFTHGDGVANAETWPAVMEASDSQIEVLNFGVSGYGVDQSLLRYREMRQRYEFDVVLICFMSKDVFEPMNTFRPFHLPATGLPYAKPRFSLLAGHLLLHPNPLPNLESYRCLLSQPSQCLETLSEHDFYYHKRYQSEGLDVLRTVRVGKIILSEIEHRRLDHSILEEGTFDEQSEVVQLTVAILSAFATEVSETGATPIFVFLPNQTDIERSRLGKSVQYGPLKAQLVSMGHRVIDTQDAFKEGSVEQLIRGHYTVLGNRRVGEVVTRQETRTRRRTSAIRSR